MSQQCLIAKCHECQKRYAESSPDKNNPFFDDESSFCLVLEWKNKDEIIKTVSEQKCPKCGSEDWYLTDASEH